LALDIIWNIIDSVGVSALKSFATEEIVSELKILFESLMKSGYKLEDKVKGKNLPFNLFFKGIT